MLSRISGSEEVILEKHHFSSCDTLKSGRRLATFGGTYCFHLQVGRVVRGLGLLFNPEHGISKLLPIIGKFLQNYTKSLPGILHRNHRETLKSHGKVKLSL
jgi:hypothetical protein